MTAEIDKTNYRVYDQTGGGGTEDIYATSLEDAIKQGREWIESGDWERGECDEVLECAVAEIVRDEDGDIDEDATWKAPRHDCSGTLPAKDAPVCLDGDTDSHDWQSPYEVVGGIKENPGVWGSGHGQVMLKEVCACCGAYRTVDHGATNSSNGLRTKRTSYAPADEKSRTWLFERLNLPEEIEIKGVTVNLDWDKTADITDADAVLGHATHTVPADDLTHGVADGPNDGEIIDVGDTKFRLGQHDYKTSDGQVTCTAAVYRIQN